MVSWLDKLLPTRVRRDGANRHSVPEGLWLKCDPCGTMLYRPDLERNLYVCTKCGHHKPLGARQRLKLFLDEDTQPEEIGEILKPIDRLRFKDVKRYRERLAQAQRATGENDALVTLVGHLQGRPLVVCAFEFGFMGGSMGAVVGERFARAAAHAAGMEVPLVCFCASGGARMQEGLGSLMQMAKTSAALVRFKRRGLPYISVLGDPTMGGVAASLASLGDLILAEPGALLGFAGPRVIEQTMGEPLPEGFQRSESVLQHGGIDMIVDRRQLRERVAALLEMLMQPRQATSVATA